MTLILQLFPGPFFFPPADTFSQPCYVNKYPFSLYIKHIFHIHFMYLSHASLISLYSGT